MLRYLIIFLLAIITSSCSDNSVRVQALKSHTHIVPTPKEMTIDARASIMTAMSKLYTAEAELLPIVKLIQDDLQLVSGKKMAIAKTNDNSADIILKIDSDLSASTYSIDIKEQVNISAGSYQAMCMARATLIQLVSIENGQIAFPQMSLKDHPDAAYRGLMIDLARQWHNLESVKQLIDLAAYYKTNYVQLHFTDYQSYTLPSDQFPKLPTPDRHYTKSQLEDLEAYASTRGITIIPELEVPGHASSMTIAYPELFGLKDIADNPWIINMGKEEVYQAIDKLVGEMVKIFQATPYIHVGGDEAIFKRVMDDPDVKAYMLQHNLGDDVHELYRHFLVRLNEIVKKHGKQMCVWEGFGREGIVPIPKDIIVYEFETNRYLPNHLVEDGYTVVNTSWKPIYVVNQKKWEPKTIYDWNMWLWTNWWPKAPSIQPIQVKESPLIIGAQMCAWEQAQEQEFPSIRQRLPVMNERIWNTTAVLSYDEFENAMAYTDKRLSEWGKDSRQDSLLHGHNFTAEMEKH